MHINAPPCRHAPRMHASGENINSTYIHSAHPAPNPPRHPHPTLHQPSPQTHLHQTTSSHAPKQRLALALSSFPRRVKAKPAYLPRPQSLGEYNPNGACAGSPEHRQRALARCVAWRAARLGSVGAWVEPGEVIACVVAGLGVRLGIEMYVRCVGRGCGLRGCGFVGGLGLLDGGMGGLVAGA